VLIKTDISDTTGIQNIAGEKYDNAKILYKKISDHQQSVAPAPSKGLPHIPSSAGGR